MRKLMWITIGFALTCGLCTYGILRQKWILPSALLLFVLFLLGQICKQRSVWIHRLAVIFLGCSLGFVWFLGYNTLYVSPLDRLVGSESALRITASDYGVDTTYGTRVDGILVQDEKRYQIRAYLKERQHICPGDTVAGNFSVEFVGQKASNYFNSKGIFLFAYEESEMTVSQSEDLPIWCFPAVLRYKIKSLLDASFPQDTSPFAKALLLGDSSELDYATDTSFKISGIRHIIAVSGLHISILYGLICVLTLRRRFLTAAVGIPVLILFAAVAGFTPSVVRACIMVCLMQLAMVFDKEYDAPTALAFAVLLMLMMNPMAVASVSLQMSVSCVAGILLFQKPAHNWLNNCFPQRYIPKKLRSMVCSSISVTVSAMSLVTPLSALYFGAVSLVGILTNVLTLWVVSFVFYGIMFVCLLGYLMPGAAVILASVLSWPIRYVLLAAKILASAPLAAVYTKSVYIVVWLVFVYVLLMAFLLQRKKHPAVFICCCMIGLCFALLASWAEPLTDSVRITMLDVGQGQSILLQSEGKTFLVDCGGDDDAETADTIAETLLSQGISRLDGIVLTHYDRDHSGALHNLLCRIDTDLLILPDTRNEFPLPETDAEIRWIWEDMEFCFGKAKMTVFGPVYSGLDNENSLCVLFDTENCDILITGDRSEFGERMLMRRTALPDVDILVAGHHGAAASTSEELLRCVTPETVLISVKENNYYGHPSDILLQRLRNFGCAVYRTDLHGTITIRR